MQRSSVMVTPALVLAVLTVALLAAVTLLPGARHQVALSLGHEPVRNLEIYFPPGDVPPRCGEHSRRLTVRFDVVSHLAGTRRIPYTVVVRSPHRRPVRTGGSTLLSPGESASVERTVPRPRAGRFVVVVRLPGRPQRLALHCPTSGGRR